MLILLVHEQRKCGVLPSFAALRMTGCLYSHALHLHNPVRQAACLDATSELECLMSLALRFDPRVSQLGSQWWYSSCSACWPVSDPRCADRARTLVSFSSQLPFSCTLTYSFTFEIYLRRPVSYLCCVNWGELKRLDLLVTRISNDSAPNIRASLRINKRLYQVTRFVGLSDGCRKMNGYVMYCDDIEKDGTWSNLYIYFHWYWCHSSERQVMCRWCINLWRYLDYLF
jgi:hypothetical protein